MESINVEVLLVQHFVCHLVYASPPDLNLEKEKHKISVSLLSHVKQMGTSRPGHVKKMQLDVGSEPYLSIA